MGREVQDSEEEWVAEAQEAMHDQVQSEFKGLIAKLRKEAGYDLNWYQKLIWRARRALRLRKLK